jgi:predicted RNA-binding protein with PIN domain
MSEEPNNTPPRRWLVDGFNVLHTAVLRGRERGTWWEADARAQLLARVHGFEDSLAALWIVFDGPRPVEQQDNESAGPFVVFAPSADEWLLKEVRRSETPDQLVVVTADRKLADKARHHGAQIASPRAFLARCPQSETAL